jgi:hypothetical protein
MKLKLSIILVIFTLLLATLACGFSNIPGVTSLQQATNDLQTAVARSLAETAIVQTIIAQNVAGTLGPVAGTDSDPAQGTLQISSPFPVNTDPPTLTPTFTLSPTPEKPMVSVSQETNCRTGPGAVYDWLGVLNIGQQAEIYARDPANSSWYIRNPNNQAVFCWIYGAYATVTGNTSSLPIFTPMPTPTPVFTATPVNDFSLVTYGASVCGIQFYIRFGITNTGGTTWQSYQTTVTDTVTAVTAVYSRDQFDDYIGCAAGLTQNDLTPGEPGYAHSNIFLANPGGHAMVAVVKVCSLDGLGGTCVNKTLNFTP